MEYSICEETEREAARDQVEEVSKRQMMKKDHISFAKLLGSYTAHYGKP